MKKYISIHGHFYQPPRENPWTGEVDPEPSAAPNPNWNERITRECYEANAKASILDAHGQVVERVNNFEKISFNFGPTLMAWLRRKEPVVYQAILEADRKSVLAHDGHGNAIAQCYNHMIMPLASRRDKITQVIWGMRDFEFHFRRKPEGMWLPETAVDRETLDVLAEQDIRFTILSPHQASRVRHLGFGSRWQPVQGEAIDTRQPYRIVLSRGRQMHLFFYDGPLSRGMAFAGLLNSGDNLAHQLANAFGGRHDRPRLLTTATDGETFGHHHKFGEMAVAYGLKKIEREGSAKLTNFGEFLARFGSFWEADIHDNTSWSCAHGVERWRADCGCRIGHQEGVTQAWRGPLRESFDFLKEIVDDVFDSEGGRLFKNPWEARNDYVALLLDDAPERREDFLKKHGTGQALKEERRFWDLLEAEKFALFMFTSCGWFFDELTGVEPAIVLRYAARAIEKIQPFAPKGFEEEFLRILGQAKSSQGSGAEIFQKLRDGRS